MKHFTFALFLIAAANFGFAHDEGHGPKLTDPAKFGGMIAPVILKKDVPIGRKAKMHYKAEVTKKY